MSPLPQRKKSAEEIAQLRESLGVPTSSAAIPSQAQAPASPKPQEAAPQPNPAPAKPKLSSTAPKASASALSTVSVLEPIIEAPVPSPHSDIPQKMIFSTFEAGNAPSAPPRLKAVRSLKKSEQTAVATPTPAQSRPDSPIPTRRRSDQEIEELWKREHLALLNPSPPNPKLTPAHPLLIIPGYLLAIAGASRFCFDSFPWSATIGCAFGAELFALLILMFRPASKHHAGFITAITMLFVVFSPFHHFPHLQYAP